VSSSIQTLALGGGCFWCTEAVFVKVQGVTDVESGYSNGQLRQPSYEQVCSGNTGHAEVVKLEFDPQIISLREILEIFFVIHDPTTRNAQGNDHGTQYRSGIYFTDVTQQATAQQVLDESDSERVLRPPHRDRAAERAKLLARRGLPPGLFRPQSASGLLPGGRGSQSRQISQDLRSPGQGLSRQPRLRVLRCAR
jgi:peptide-methionine (S)-S-oxide reductase